MRKEVIYALIAGAFMGVIIAFGVWRANSAFKPNGAKSPEYSPSITPPPQFGITVAKPDNLSVISSNPVEISGITIPDSWIVISLDENDYIFKSSKDGTFNQEVNLSGGVNQLQVAALGPTGEVSSDKLILVYSTEFSKSQAPSEAKPTPTPSDQNAYEGSEIRQKVIEKVEQALKNPGALLGVVTDISTNTIQIKSSSGEIRQMSVQDGSSIVKMGKESKEVKFSDIAIGDFVVAMGFQNGQEILEATRILITQEPAKITVTPLLGIVTEVDKKTVTLKIQEEKEITLSFPKKWQGPEINKIKEGDELIAVGKLAENTLEIRTVFLIPSPTPTP